MSPHSTSYTPSLGNCISDLLSFGEIDLPSGAAKLSFQIDIDSTSCPNEVWFGLLCHPESTQLPASGFAIRIDFARGEVWDVQNGFGLLATIEEFPSWQTDVEVEDTLLLSLNIEKCGPNLIPTLNVGGSTVLYPSLSETSLSGKTFTAVAGAIQSGRDADPFLHFPAFWLTQPES
jgi:hypothetical protein